MLDSADLGEVPLALDCAKSDNSQVSGPANSLDMRKSSEVSDSSKTEVPQSSKIRDSAVSVDSGDISKSFELSKILDFIDTGNSDVS